MSVYGTLMVFSHLLYPPVCIGNEQTEKPNPGRTLQSSAATC